MRAAVITFPGSNCDRDLAVAMEAVSGAPVLRVWHRETELPTLDLIGVPGGFSYGDYLRCGAMAARSPVMREVGGAPSAGAAVLGICNGFQILTEAGLLPGALMRNAGLRFVCRRRAGGRDAGQPVHRRATARPARCAMPVAHHDGNYVHRRGRPARLEGEDRVAFRYRDNPNGSAADIAGVLGPSAATSWA